MELPEESARRALLASRKGNNFEMGEPETKDSLNVVVCTLRIAELKLPERIEQPAN